MYICTRCIEKVRPAVSDGADGTFYTNCECDICKGDGLVVFDVDQRLVDVPELVRCLVATFKSA